MKLIWFEDAVAGSVEKEGSNDQRGQPAGFNKSVADATEFALHNDPVLRQLAGHVPGCRASYRTQGQNARRKT
jgi:hypothetical protein